MIPFDFDYYRPDTVWEAVQLFECLDGCQKSPLYYSGGTEIITSSRLRTIHAEAVIDIKAIPECQALGFAGSDLVIGAAVPLTGITGSRLFPLLGKTCARIADHTAQGKITLGGNVCGRIIYREALLPLLLTDCRVVVAGGRGFRQAPIGRVFDRQMLLDRGEFIIQFLIDKSCLEMPHMHIKRTANEKIDYPLVTVTAINHCGYVKTAFSGLCSFPFRSREMEEALNAADLPVPQRVREALANLPAPLLDNVAGTPAYRRFVLSDVLTCLLEGGLSDA